MSLMWIGNVCGVIGLALCAIGIVTDSRHALTSYLFAYATVLTVVLGALIQIMIGHVTAAHWFTILRRRTLMVTTAVPVLAVLALPLLLGVHVLYVWTSPTHLPADVQASVVRKAAWLNVPFFVVRALIYLVVWIVLAEALRRWSLRLDSTQGSTAAFVLRRQRRLSAIGLIGLGLTLTFAAFDWLMSLEPSWYSTIYGVYVFAGGILGALGLIAVMAYAMAYTARRRDDPRHHAITPEHFGALGKLMLTFVIFWGYIAFSQYLIIWIGDIPSEASWYVSRSHGSWGVLAMIVAIGQFAVPCALLLSRELKRRPAALAAIGLWLLVMHVLDVYWLVLPALYPAGMQVSWLDLAALLMVGGFAAATVAWRARCWNNVPSGDPYLRDAMTYREP
jgi:hypothetical protein